MSAPRPWRLAEAADAPFPPAGTALRRPDGLLAVGGDLEPVRLLNAYASGIFPWSSEGGPLLWWSPDPRVVFRTDAIHLSRRFRRQARGCGWTVTADTAFDAVMQACASVPRPGQEGTWIDPAMQHAYAALHALGAAHSLEVWDEAQLVGGIYGVGMGRMFFGESMFSARSGGSKVALAALGRLLHDWGIPVLDAQVENPHLMRMGAVRWPRQAFLDHVRDHVRQPGPMGRWTDRVGRRTVRQLIDG